MRLRKENMLFSLSGAATVKFAHSHAFFVSLNFHVEANSQPEAIFLPASFIQWGHTVQNPGNVKNGKVSKVSGEVYMLSEDGWFSIKVKMWSPFTTEAQGVTHFFKLTGLAPTRTFGWKYDRAIIISCGL